MKYSRFDTIVAFCDAMTWAVDQETVYQRIVDVAAEYFECDSAHLHMLDIDGQRFVRHAAHELEDGIDAREQPITLSLGRMDKLVMSGELIVMEDYMRPHEDDVIPDYAIELGYKSAVSIPLASNSGVLGMLTIVYKRELPWAEGDYSFLLEAGHVLGTFIQRIQMSKKDVELQVLRERKHLSSEIHDNLSQMVSVLALRADIAASCLDEGDSEGLKKELESIGQQARQVTKVLREEMLALRAPIEGEGDAASDVEAILKRFADQWGYEVSFTSALSASAVISEYARLQLARIVNEALQNILRHAHATLVEASIERKGSKVIITIRDNGIGFDAASVAPERLGIRIMRERAASVGGSVTVASNGSGTAVIIEMPVSKLQ